MKTDSSYFVMFLYENNQNTMTNKAYRLLNRGRYRQTSVTNSILPSVARSELIDNQTTSSNVFL